MNLSMKGKRSADVEDLHRYNLLDMILDRAKSCVEAKEDNLK